jgi:glutaredoxin
MGCPYCQKVRDYLAKENITVPMKDIYENPANRDELIKIGGKAQVPCLVIDGKALYESSDIIEWFKRRG